MGTKRSFAPARDYLLNDSNEPPRDDGLRILFATLLREELILALDKPLPFS
ncbi:MAG: hypothetical protein ACLQAT_17295 [Candidatus Binataceae bacterium]